MLDVSIVAIFCANLITISLLTPEIVRGVFVTFGTTRQKSAYPTKYLSKYMDGTLPYFSRIYWTDFHDFFHHVWGL